MTTAEIVKTVADAFDNCDCETILGHMADDVQWLMLGSESLIGKESLKQFFLDNPNLSIISYKRDNFIVNDNKVVINGEVSCLTSDDKVCDMFYCDIYELQGDKIIKMTSYMIDNKR